MDPKSHDAGLASQALAATSEKQDVEDGKHAGKNK